MKKLYPLILFAVLYLIPVEKNGLFTYPGLEEYNGFSVSFSAAEKIFEPLFGLGRYLGALPYWRSFLLMVLAWLIVISVLHSILKKKKLFIILFRYIFGLITVITLIVFSWTPELKITKNRELFLFDLQSHTYHSWDGFYTPEDSRKWHKKNGYDAFFITDHWNMDGMKSAGSDKKIDVYYGMEAARDGDYFIINENPDGSDGLDHIISNGRAIPLFHWEQKNPERYEKKMFYGYEMYNQGHPQFDLRRARMKQQEMRENNTPGFAGTDWHGYLSFSWAWSVFEMPEDSAAKKIIPLNASGRPDLGKIIFSRKRPADNRLFSAAVYGKRIIHKLKPSYFEPWRSLFIYFAGLDFAGTVSWLFWVYLIFLLKRGQVLEYLFSGFMLLWFGRLFYLGLYFRSIYFDVLEKNQILNDTSTLLILFSFIYLFWKSSRFAAGFYKRKI